QRRHDMRIAHVLLFISLLSLTVSAQTFRGTILGTIVDPQGALVPGAKITVRNTSTGLERSTTSDEAGNYTVPELPVGPYEVGVEMTGFAKATVTNVRVEVAGERRVDVMLSISTGDALVFVATDEQVQTTSNALGGTITTKTAADLPINGRDFTKFLIMVP